MLRITRTEVKWLLTALSTHIETCTELMQEPSIGNLQYQLLNHQRGNYEALRAKLESSVNGGAKTIRID